MIAEDHTNIFKAEINKNYELEYNGRILNARITDIIKGSRMDEDGTLQDFVVDDEYLWNMEDQVGLLMPEEKMNFTVKR